MAGTGPRRPRGLRTGGRRLWDAVENAYILREDEGALLGQACRVLDRLDRLAAVVEADGLLVDGRPHPALVESRQQQIVLARLLATLRLPDDLGQQPQRRSTRGVYRLRSVQ
jgi:hypothetical protein